jgi:hypothetical protein
MMTLLALALTMTLSTEARPDFSGQWTTAPEVTTPAAGARGAGPGRGPGGPGGGPGRGRGEMGSGWGPTIRITQTAQQLTVEYAFYTRGDMQPPLKFVYALDGSETKNVVMAGHGTQEQRSKTAWNGDALVITTTHMFTDPTTGKAAPTIVTQTLSLASPASLVVDVTRKGVLGGPDTVTKTTYRKIS